MTHYKQGSPAWADLATADVSWMLTFYQALFGWDDLVVPREDGAPPYHLQQLGGVSVAAIYQQPREEARNGVPPYWNTHLAVDDIEATAARVADLGGTVLTPPAAVGAAGRMSVVADPGGAVLRLWQAGEHIGAGAVLEPGTLSWSELQTSAPDRAAAFLHELVGVETRLADLDGKTPYTWIEVGGVPVAGIRRVPQYVVPRWVSFFEVADLEATIAIATAKGGNVRTAPAEGPRGPFATLQDPQGALFGLLRSEGAAG